MQRSHKGGLMNLDVNVCKNQHWVCNICGEKFQHVGRTIFIKSKMLLFPYTTINSTRILRSYMTTLMLWRGCMAFILLDLMTSLTYFCPCFHIISTLFLHYFLDFCGFFNFRNSEIWDIKNIWDFSDRILLHLRYKL